MKDNQKKYLDKVVEILVGETIIDYEKEKVYISSFSPLPFYFSLSFLFYFFTRYCKNSYGIGENEIEYVWDQYRDIIKEKIDNEK